MKKITFLILSAVMLTTFSWQLSAQTTVTSSPAVAIPDFNTTGVSDVINITDANSVSDINIGLEIRHTWIGDVGVTIQSPSGTTVTIVDRPGNPASSFGCLNNNISATLDDEASLPVENECASSSSTSNPPTSWAILGSFTPNNPLSAFDGEPINGNWTITVTDAGFGDTGFLDSWSITYETVVVVGNPPVIACPANITADNVPGTCGAVANFTGVAFDTEDGVISGDIVYSHTSGSTFPVGDTTVTLSVTDSDNNTVSCDFIVTVLDVEFPVAVCQDITIDLDPVTGTATITPADIDNGSTDNCGIDFMGLDITTFDCSMIGANTVTLDVMDASGNTSTCTATVTVQDVTAPEIFCIGGFGTFTESEDFEGATIPTGWTTVVESGAADWAFGSGVMPIGGDFASNAAIFDDDAAGTGAPNLVRLVSPVYDLTGASNVQVSFDYAIQDFIGFGIFEVSVWDGAAWQQILFVDDTDVAPVNSGNIDVSAYANAGFQVRFTYDDEGDWAWGAGVDNFLLSYEAVSGGGLDVFLDANGMATVNPNDLLTGVNEACGYTITAGGAGGGTMGSLTSLFAGGNNGAAGWAVMYDVTVGPNDIEITDLDVNTSSTTAINLDLYTLVGSYVGNELDAAAWGAPVATGTGTGAGVGLPSNLVLDTPVTLTANTTYGIAVVLDAAPYYTNGDGTNQSYSNADLSMDLGAAVNGLFTGLVFSPRVWNGTINYTVGSGSGLDFTCADLGENLVEVTVTDASGNESTCTAIVNVIDNIAPVITCGPEPTVSETVSDSPALAITDNDPVGVTSIISVTEDITLEDLDVNLDITHTWIGDLIVSITSPAGTTVTLIDQIGTTTGGLGCSGDDILATLDDAAASPVENQCGTSVPAVDGTFSPNNPLAAFNGESTLGDWVITISDNAGGDTGTLNAWGITYSYANASTNVIVELGPDGTANIDPYSLINSVDEACGIDTAAVDVPMVSCADIGTVIAVTVFVTDASGNLASCVANVEVVDLLAPEITCPADQTVDPGPGNVFYILPDYFATGEATAVDNCTDPVTVTSQSPAVGTPLADGVHTITLTATDEYGNESTCTFELTVESVLGVNQNSLDAGIALYPNPASNVVNLVNKTDIALDTMMIYDINGKLVNQVSLTTMQGEKAVDVSSLATGVYVVRIIGNNASTVKRLIIK